MKQTLFLVLIASISGCAVYKATPEMDYGLNEQGHRLAAASSISVAKQSSPLADFQLKRLAEDNASLFQGKGRSEVSLIEFGQKHPYGGKGFQCFEPFLMVLSLGIIPSMCEQESTLVVGVKTPGTTSVIRRDITYKTESIAGWLALFYAPSQKWNFKSENEEERALFTLLNRMATETANEQ